jgi:hypothetical protein
MTQRVEIPGPHHHQGQRLEPGAVIEVDDDTAEWLKKHAGAKKAATPRKKSETGAVAEDSQTEEQQ